MAVANYENQHRRLPPTVTEDGYHSWRTLILPFFEDNLDESVNLRSPWDSEENRKLHPQIPHSFQCHNREDGTASTQMFAITGHGSVWSDEWFRPNKAALLIIELDLPDVCWMEPKDVSIRDLVTMLQAEGKLPGPHLDGIIMAFADFSVRFVRHDEITPEFLNSLSTVDNTLNP